MSPRRRPVDQDDETHELDFTALESFIRDQVQAESVFIGHAEKLSGGAIQENWLLEVSIEGGLCPGDHEWVLRADAKSSVQQSLSRPQEFAVLNLAFNKGVKVPRPLWLCEQAGVIGRPFFVMEKVAGSAGGQVLTSRVKPGGSPELAFELGANLARVHTIQPPEADLDFLRAPHDSSFEAKVAQIRTYLDTLGQPQPVIEWGLRWCENNVPRSHEICLLHGDYRTGNYMVDGESLQAVLDWEFTEWGNPLQDIGWFTAKCWRFARPDLEAGGVGALGDFLRGYNSVTSLNVDAHELNFWQVFATIRWAVIALQQGERHASGTEISLELALTGRMLPELNQDILILTGGLRP
ncbi:phosphotransferase family protein [Pseudomonas monteilii]|uniref:phosphotransferase family protein n=1 Tax=Pseudomonas monteilii TaxID=76759 RepID=UPI003D086795